MHAHSRNMQPSSSGMNHNISIADLLPPHVARALRYYDENLHMISDANLIDMRAAPSHIKIAVTLDKIIATDVKVYVFRGGINPTDGHTALMCATLSALFQKDTILDIEGVRIFVQSLINVFGSRVIAEAGLVNILQKWNIRLVIQEIDTQDANALEGFMKTPDVTRCRDLLNLDSMTDPHMAMQAYSAAALLLAGKKLTAASADQWTRRRVKELAAAMGTVIDPGSVTPFNPKMAQMIYQKISVQTDLRAKFIRILFSAAAGADTLQTRAAKAMLNSLAWAEMSYFWMVHEFILLRYPELLAIPLLKSCNRVLETAYKYMQQLPEEERPYAKLLYDSQQTKALKRDRFLLLIDAADAVRNHLYPSFANYQGGATGRAGVAIKRTVGDYLKSLDSKHLQPLQTGQHGTHLSDCVIGDILNSSSLKT